MNSELRREMVNILKVLAHNPTRALGVSRTETTPTQISAAVALHAAGYLVETSNALPKLNGAAITLRGFDYLEELTSPRKTWLRRNWFAVAVALITASTALADIVIRLQQGSGA